MVPARIGDGHPVTDNRLLGQSPAMVRLLESIRRLAPTRVPVVITGESGVGKELVARALHAGAAWSGGPFGAANCGALPDGLVQSELFGHVRGAFTGAEADRVGVFEAADGGTLLLDEVVDLPPSAQVSLLRVLATGEVRRVGDRVSRPIQVRVVAATSRDVDAAVASGAFRPDLWYRLQGARLHVPALRERPGDALLLADAFLRRAGLRHGRPELGLSAAARVAVAEADWPGNVRELQNAIERAAVLADGPSIEVEDLFVQGADLHTQRPTLREARANFEARYLEEMLRLTRGNVSAAARRAGVHRTEFHRLMRRHDLAAESFRGLGAGWTRGRHER
jgi:DNA-binding NtrC family response regulator